MQSDILLHTSLSEGHPIVVEEAMSSGVVVCGTKVGLLYDLPDCCISVDVKDFESLAAATLELIHDSHRIIQVRQLAYQWATRHSMQWTVDEMMALYSTRIHG
jgi:glycosyltransferase involved in cell wall biosynthesis